MFIGEANELSIILHGNKAKALIDSRTQISSISKSFAQKLKLKINGLQTILNLETTRGSEIPYLGYAEAHFKIPEVEAFNQDVLMLGFPDSPYSYRVLIALGMLHIDMLLNSATKKELEILNNCWKRGT